MKPNKNTPAEQALANHFDDMISRGEPLMPPNMAIVEELKGEVPLLRMLFSRAVVTYTQNFNIELQGSLWPREMKCAMAIIELYKEENKRSAQRGDK